MSLVESLPLPLRRFVTGRWPYLWIGIGAFFGALAWAAPAAIDARRAAEKADLERARVEREETVAARLGEERARRDALLAWWRSWSEQRVRGGSIGAAEARLEDFVRTTCEGVGVRVERLERAPGEPLLDSPPASLVTLTLTLSAERMGSLAQALGALESGGEKSPWLRVGNATIRGSGVRLVTGVRVETTLYAVVETGS